MKNNMQYYTCNGACSNKKKITVMSEKNCLLHNYVSSLGSKVFKIPIYKQISPINIKSR